ncbi:hypothetical protein Bbelb_236200 [Branchiostoma belcheri]|nr:hypothetical protein Bbelb_236200 [Branchiostoma belcheri]
MRTHIHVEAAAAPREGVTLPPGGLLSWPGETIVASKTARPNLGCKNWGFGESSAVQEITMVFNTGSVVITNRRIRVYTGGVGVDCGYNKQEVTSSSRPISEQLKSALEAIKKTFQRSDRERPSTTAVEHEKQVAGH